MYCGVGGLCYASSQTLSSVPGLYEAVSPFLFTPEPTSHKYTCNLCGKTDLSARDLYKKHLSLPTTSQSGWTWAMSEVDLKEAGTSCLASQLRGNTGSRAEEVDVSLGPSPPPKKAATGPLFAKAEPGSLKRRRLAVRSGDANRPAPSISFVVTLGPYSDRPSAAGAGGASVCLTFGSADLPFPDLTNSASFTDDGKTGTGPPKVKVPSTVDHSACGTVGEKGPGAWGGKV